MTAAIAIPATTSPAAAALAGAGASASPAAAQTQAAGAGFAAALAALLNGGVATAQPQAQHAPKHQLAATTDATAATPDANIDASAVVVPLVPGLILPTPTQAPANAEQATPAAQINAQASQASALQILQAAQVTATDQPAATTDRTPAETAAATVPVQAFAALAATAQQQTQTPAPTNVAKAPKAAASKEAPLTAGKDQLAANANGTQPTTESKAEANTHLANAIQHALSNDSNGNAQSNGKGNGSTTELPATASPVAVAIHTAAIDSTATTAPTVAPAAATAAVPLDALAVHIARKFEGGESRFEIRLDPIELGKLDISVTVTDDGRVQAVMRAERPETLDMLQRDARVLENQLRQNGLNVDSGSLSFSLNQGNNQRSGFAGNDQAFANAFNAAPEPEVAATNTTTTVVNVRDGVDIRI